MGFCGFYIAVLCEFANRQKEVFLSDVACKHIYSESFFDLLP